jgi:hypothetical protein
VVACAPPPAGDPTSSAAIWATRSASSVAGQSAASVTDTVTSPTSFLRRLSAERFNRSGDFLDLLWIFPLTEVGPDPISDRRSLAEEPAIARSSQYAEAIPVWGALWANRLPGFGR